MNEGFERDVIILPKDVIHPKKDCPKCQGTGNFRVCEDIPGEPSRIPGRLKQSVYSVECDCILKQKVDRYLTPRFVDVLYSDSIDISQYINKNLLFQENLKLFKTFAKTFLVNTEAKIPFLCYETQSLFNIYFEEKVKWDTLICNIDLLMITCMQDPHNKMYGSVLSSLIQKRTEMQKATWVFTGNLISSDTFQNIYSNKFSDFLKDQMKMDLLIEIVPNKKLPLQKNIVPKVIEKKIEEIKDIPIEPVIDTPKEEIPEENTSKNGKYNKKEPIPAYDKPPKKNPHKPPPHERSHKNK